MYGESRVREFRVRYLSLRLVSHHRVGGVTNAEAWVGLGVEFWNPPMEAILRCRVKITLNTIWDS